MPTTNPLELIRFGIHRTLGMVIYCSGADCPRWRLSVWEIDTLPWLTQQASIHLDAHHPAALVWCVHGHPLGACCSEREAALHPVVSTAHAELDDEPPADYMVGDSASPPYPGERWAWPLDCPKCGAGIGPWSPDTVGSEMTHIRPGGGPDWQANQDHDVPSIPVDSVSRETRDRGAGFFPDRQPGTPRPVPHPSPRDAG